jgi:hypothetical protein
LEEYRCARRRVSVTKPVVFALLRYASQVPEQRLRWLRIVPPMVLFVGGLGGCVTAEAVGIATDRALTDRGEVVLGWGIEHDDIAHVVRWRECQSVTACTTATHERSAGELEATDVLGMGRVETSDGRAKVVEIMRLHFGPPPANRLTQSTEIRARMNEAAPEVAP